MQARPILIALYYDIVVWSDNVVYYDLILHNYTMIAHNGTEKQVFRPQCSFDVIAQI